MITWWNRLPMTLRTEERLATFKGRLKGWLNVNVPMVLGPTDDADEYR